MADFALSPLKGEGIGAFFEGAALPFRGAFFLLARPRLWLLALIPLALNVALFAAALYWGGAFFSSALRQWIGGGHDAAWYWKIALGLAQFFFWAIVLLLVYFVFTPVALVVGSPFFDLLAEQAEEACGFRFQDGLPLWKSLLAMAFYSVVIQCKNLAVVLAVFALLLPLHLIPVAGSVLYAALSALWLVLTSTFQFTSYPCDRRRMRYREKWRLLADNWAFALGFGCSAAAALLVPFLNVMVMPACAVAGTFYYGMARDGEGKWE